MKLASNLQPNMLVVDMEKFVSPQSGGKLLQELFRIHDFYLVLLYIGSSNFSRSLKPSFNSPYDYIFFCLCLFSENWFFIDEKEPVAHALVEVVEASDVKPSDLNG